MIPETMRKTKKASMSFSLDGVFSEYELMGVLMGEGLDWQRKKGRGVTAGGGQLQIGGNRPISCLMGRCFELGFQGIWIAYLLVLRDCTADFGGILANR